MYNNNTKFYIFHLFYGLKYFQNQKTIGILLFTANYTLQSTLFRARRLDWTGLDGIHYANCPVPLQLHFHYPTVAVLKPNTIHLWHTEPSYYTELYDNITPLFSVHTLLSEAGMTLNVVIVNRQSRRVVLTVIIIYDVRRDPRGNLFMKVIKSVAVSIVPGQVNSFLKFLSGPKEEFYYLHWNTKWLAWYCITESGVLKESHINMNAKDKQIYVV